MSPVQEKEILTLASSLMRGRIGPTAFYGGLTEAIASAVGCNRASIWRFTSDARERIICMDLFDTRTRQHRGGETLTREAFTPYFNAIQANILLMATDARHHPATECFNEAYFQPNDIFSLLDVGIDALGKGWGLFCCEHAGAVKAWTDEDAALLRSVGNLCGMAFARLKTG